MTDCNIPHRIQAFPPIDSCALDSFGHFHLSLRADSSKEHKKLLSIFLLITLKINVAISKSSLESCGIDIASLFMAEPKPLDDISISTCDEPK